jgi:transcription-repair coupling factor (superfamily II helicase)
MKKQKLVGYFISDQQSEYYQSEIFTKVLKFVQENPELVSMKEKNTRKGLRLIVSFNSIRSINDALRSMDAFSA